MKWVIRILMNSVEGKNGMQIQFRCLIPLLILFFVTGCTDPATKCVEPDDFGYPKVTVYSERDDIDLVDGSDEDDDMVSEWEYSGYIVHGNRQLVISVEDVEESDRWTSWHEGDEDQVEDTCSCLDALVNDQGTPCWYVKACGLYALIMPIDEDDRNDKADDLPDLDDLDVARNPPPPYTVLHLNYQGLNEYRSPTSNPPRGRLYFKILDDDYDDNAGEYVVRLKDGVLNPQYGLVMRVVDFVKDVIDEVTIVTYERVVAGSPLKRSLQAALVLFVIFTAIMFIFGLINMTQGELIVRIIKFSIIATVVSDTSWDFFNTYFFTPFTDGSLYLMALYATAGTTATIHSKFIAPVNFDFQEPLEFFDRLLELVISGETIHKMVSVVFDDWWGIVMAIGMLIAAILFVLAIIKGIVLYLISIMVLSLLIIIFPVFVIFALFKVTRDLFKSYIKTMIAYTMQPILLFALIGMFCGAAYYTIHQNLGFRACWNSWWDVRFDIGDVSEDFFAVELPEWAPESVIRVYDFRYFTPDHDAKDRILDLGEFDCEDSSPEVLAQVDKEFPFWDPATNKGCDRIEDALDRDYVNLWDVLLMLLICYLFFHFVNIIGAIANAITQQYNTADLYLTATASAISPFADRAYGLFGKAFQSAKGRFTGGGGGGG